MASGRRELVKWLLDGRPSQVNATNHEGRTPLHIAAATDNADLCRLLLDRGAEVNPVARSSKNEPLTPLDCATTRGHRSTAKYIQMHGGLPASKLSNTQIVIDGAPITSLPTRKVTSTKIDVRDKIRIEKREVVEISSPIHERRRSKNNSESSNDSSDSRKASRRRSENKYSDRHRERRKKLVHAQKSFSDGYESDVDGRNKDSSHDKKYQSSKKNRSRSEPSKRHKANAKQRQRRYRSDSESSSESDSYSEKKKSKRHRKRSKRKNSSITESSSSESTERRSTKRKGKKTSIHIENDDEKQSVNIVKFKSVDRPDYAESIESRVSLLANSEQAQVPSLQIDDKEDDQMGKSRAHSETETDTLSVKTNMVVTEAQIHMERQSSQQGNSEITVTLDSSNNVSIEAANMSVTQKDITEGIKSDSEKSIAQATAEDLEVKSEAKEVVSGKEQPSDVSASTSGETKPDSNMESSAKEGNQGSNGDDGKSQTQGEGKEEPSSKLIEETPEETKEPTESSKGTELNPSSIKTPENMSKSPSPTLELARKRSFQVLSGPDEALSHVSGDNKTSLDVTSLEKSESQEKITSPVVSFAAKDEVFESKDSDKMSEHLMGKKVSHGEGSESEVQTGVNLVKDSSESHNGLEEKRNEYAASTTGSSTENTQNSEKGDAPVIGESVSSEDRAVQQVIMENVSGEYDVDLSLTPKRTRKTPTKDSQGSSRKSSIYETESYKVLSDIASGEITTGILKKTSKAEDGSLEDDKEMVVGSKSARDGSIYGRVPSVSDNEIYSHTEVNGRRKRFRKKGRTKSRTTIRSKSENSERGYESSGLMDSGFEPSPRALQRRIASPRLSAYYKQRNASGRYSGKSDSRIPVRKPGDKYAVDMKSVTQRIQTNMRRSVIQYKVSWN